MPVRNSLWPSDAQGSHPTERGGRTDGALGRAAMTANRSSDPPASGVPPARGSAGCSSIHTARSAEPVIRPAFQGHRGLRAPTATPQSWDGLSRHDASVSGTSCGPQSPCSGRSPRPNEAGGGGVQGGGRQEPEEAGRTLPRALRRACGPEDALTLDLWPPHSEVDVCVVWRPRPCSRAVTARDPDGSSAGSGRHLRRR